MRQVSLRRFRGEIADLREPVEVSRRDSSGNIQVLGFWTPYRQPVPEAEPLEDQPPVPGGTTAIREGEYVREERAPGPVLDIPIDDEPRVIRTPEEAAAIVATIPATGTPYPKDVQAGRRKRR